MGNFSSIFSNLLPDDELFGYGGYDDDPEEEYLTFSIFFGLDYSGFLSSCLGFSSSYFGFSSSSLGFFNDLK